MRTHSDQNLISGFSNATANCLKAHPTNWIHRTLPPREARIDPGFDRNRGPERWEFRNIRATVLKVADSQVASETCEVPVWGEPDKNGQATVVVQNMPEVATTLYRIPVGCTAHVGHCQTLCQIVSGQLIRMVEINCPSRRHRYRALPRLEGTAGSVEGKHSLSPLRHRARSLRSRRPSSPFRLAGIPTG